MLRQRQSHPLIRFPVVSYSKGEQIPQEAEHEIPDKKPDESWPQEGAIEFDKIQMSYRPGLPNVLKGLTFSVKGGEKIGVVGRYVLWHLI